MLFAAMGSTGMAVLFHLAQPSIQANLQREIQHDPTSRSIIKSTVFSRSGEGLRVFKSNPAPLTRSESAGGCVVDGVVDGVTPGTAPVLFRLVVGR